MENIENKVVIRLLIIIERGQKNGTIIKSKNDSWQWESQKPFNETERDEPLSPIKREEKNVTSASTLHK